VKALSKLPVRGWAIPISGEYIPPKERKELHNRVRAEAGNRCIRCNHIDDAATHHVLTVHHFTGCKSENAWWNLLALCQRCHLKVQGRVNPDVPYFLEHSEWAKPYVAGFYAFKYEGKQLTRAEVMERLDELLAYERRG
jgi:5-methylcytosine-specific restriction endonuclease McrA